MSWGGTVNKGDDGRRHMYVAQFTRHCGFDQWATNSRIVHAVADAADGQYEVNSTVWPVFAHNPTVVRAPATGEWVMTFVANASAAGLQATCSDGSVVVNSSDPMAHPLQRNFMSVAPTLDGPWSDPLPIDQPFEAAVPSWRMPYGRNRNTNLVLAIAPDNSMMGLWRRCCSPPPEYSPPGGGGASVIFTVHASDWRDLSTWRANSTAVFPQLPANGYEDPSTIWHDPKRPGVVHALFHSMLDGWHRPETNNTQVGAHAYSTDGGRSWVDTGIAFNLTVAYTDGSATTFVQRERPHVVLGAAGEPSHLVPAVTYSLLPTLPTCTIVQPINTNPRAT